MKTRSQFSRSNGFTLIEISMVLVIVGLVLASIFPQLKVYKARQDFDRTQDSIELADEAVREYYGLNARRYPCPADPRLGPGDANYGEPLCRATTADPCPAGLVCLNVGTRDADGDGTDDFVMIGALPVTDIERRTRFTDFREYDSYDAYLNKFLYVVSENMTKVNSNSQLGAIDIIDEFGRNLSNPPQSAHYAIISHGENGTGAFTREGANRGGCIITGVGTPVPPGNAFGGATGIETDKENCDMNDAMFVSALKSYGNNNDYFDDHVVYRASEVTTLWERSPSSPGPPTPATYLYNTNIGRVGVGTNTPGVKLEVGDGVSPAALRVQTAIAAENGVCEKGGGECIDPGFIGFDHDPGCTTPTEIANGVSNNGLLCDPVVFDAFNGTNYTCSTPGQFVVAISNLGNVQCGTP